MSLKTFHIVFVIVCVVLGIGFSVWSFRAYHMDNDNGKLLAGVASVIGVLIMMGYGRWFLRKLGNESYL